MTSTKPRLRMFAGPNGSGKSTVKTRLKAHWLGTYVNADEIEKALRSAEGLDLRPFDVPFTQEELLTFLQNCPILTLSGINLHSDNIRLSNGRLSFVQTDLSSYHAAAVADFIRRKLLAAGKDFSFETVMSSRDKVDLLTEAQRLGYRTYLYFVATEDPAINLSRIALRVQQGGHPVPDDKVVSRYHRSLDNLWDAILHSNRAYVFDNSGTKLITLAEITDGKEIRFDVDEVPQWFVDSVLDKLPSD